MKYVLVRQQYERIHLCESMLALLRRMAKYFSLSDLIKLVVARKIFEKKKFRISNFIKNPFHWEQFCFMRTDGHDETNSRFSQFSVRRLRKEGIDEFS